MKLIDYIISQPVSTWVHLGQLIAGSAVLATVLELLKNKADLKKRCVRLFWLIRFDGSKIITTFLMVFSAIASYADWILQYNGQHPSLLATHFSYILTGSVLVHRFAVGPVYKGIQNANQLLKDGKTFRQAVSVETVAPIEAEQPFQVTE